MSQQLLDRQKIANIFRGVAKTLHIDVMLDSIDAWPERHGYRIRSHDSLGPLPSIEIEDADEVEPVLDRLYLVLERFYWYFAMAQMNSPTKASS